MNEFDETKFLSSLEKTLFTARQVLETNKNLIRPNEVFLVFVFFHFRFQK